MSNMDGSLQANIGYCLVQLVDPQSDSVAFEYMMHAWRAGRLNKNNLYFVFLNAENSAKLFTSAEEMYDFQRLYLVVSTEKARNCLHMSHFGV